MPTSDAMPQMNALGKKTFNVLRGWDQTWSWGNVALLNQAGSYGEAFTAFAGPSQNIDALEEQVIQVATTSAMAIVEQGKLLPSFGVGRWKNNGQSLLVMQAITGSEPLCPVASLDPKLVEQVKMVVGPECFMDGPSDTVWEVVKLAVHAPSQSEAHDWFELSSRHFSPEDLKRLKGSGPLIDALCAWVEAQQLEQDLPQSACQNPGLRL